jgi:hypothetical protein
MNNRLINILSDRIYHDLQNLQEKRRKKRRKRRKKKKKNPGGRSVKHGADDNMGVSKMDFLPTDVLKGIAKKRNLDEYVEELNERKKRRKRRKKRKSSRKKPSQDPSYARGRKNPGALDKAVAAYNKAKKTPGKADDLAAIRMRDRLEKTEKPSGIPSKYNMSEKLNRESLRNLIFEIIQDEISERKRRKRRKKKSKSRKLSSKVDKSLKKKAKSANAPVGALKTIYRKGLGAFYTSGSRSGQNPHSWAMARVNSVLRGGKARQVDAAQWKSIQKFRARKRKK